MTCIDILLRSIKTKEENSYCPSPIFSAFASAGLEGVPSPKITKRDDGIPRLHCVAAIQRQLLVFPQLSPEQQAYSVVQRDIFDPSIFWYNGTVGPPINVDDELLSPGSVSILY